MANFGETKSMQNHLDEYYRSLALDKSALEQGALAQNRFNSLMSIQAQLNQQLRATPLTADQALTQPAPNPVLLLLE